MDFFCRFDYEKTRSSQPLGSLRNVLNVSAKFFSELGKEADHDGEERADDHKASIEVNNMYTSISPSGIPPPGD
ncbi:unnamed protein product, partial [Protopolystoma xenopodis]